MSFVKENGMEILMEMSSSDIYSLENVDENMSMVEIMENLEDIPELGEDIVYNEEAIPVTVEGGNYFVEHVNVAKVIGYYQRSGYNYDEETIVGKICEHYGIPEEDTYLVLESDESHRRTIFNLSEKIKKEKDPKRKTMLKMQLDGIKTRFRKLKNSEKLNLLKKKSPESSKKKTPTEQPVTEAIIKDDPEMYTWFKTEETKKLASLVKNDFRKGIEDGDWSGFKRKALDSLDKASTLKDARHIKQFVKACSAMWGGTDAGVTAPMFGLLGLAIYTLTSKQVKHRKELRQWLNTEFQEAYEKKVAKL